MDQLSNTKTRRTRRYHSAEFKAQVLREVSEPGNSIASVAQRHKLNANLVHKWLRTPPKNTPKALPAFIDVQSSMLSKANANSAILVEIPLSGDRTAKIHWPACELESLTRWLKAMLS